MKIILLLSHILFFQTAYATINICSFTFNSSDEKEAIFKGLEPYGAKLIEFVNKDDKDPTWFTRACKSNIKCDISIFSGHFGGVFFGEGTSVTLSLDELIKAKNCNIINNTRAVYLMGCNTLASKARDHRNVSEYIRVLLNDGFSLPLAQKVAASRYMDYGMSIENYMTDIFANSKQIIGFESTGPLGKYAGPMIEKAINRSSQEPLLEYGVDLYELKSAFKRTSLKIVSPSKNDTAKLKEKALTPVGSIAIEAWKEILFKKDLNIFVDFIVENSKNIYLRYLLRYNPSIKQSLSELLKSKLKLTKGLESIRLEILNFQKDHQIISEQEHSKSFKDSISNILNQKIDYVQASQLCSIFKKYPENTEDINLLKISSGQYCPYLRRCMNNPDHYEYGPVKECLESGNRHEWGCLTDNMTKLDVLSCKIAASRNDDIVNSDNMLWYCYSKMKAYKQLTKPKCLELTDSFQILGNRLKMNWNCLNRI